MSKITINHRAIAGLSKELNIALYKTADAIISDIVDKQVMPFDVGTMQNDSTFVSTTKKDNQAIIVTNTPYARRLYFHPEYNFKRENNRYAGSHWYEPWMSKGKYAGWVIKRFELFVKECANV